MGKRKKQSREVERDLFGEPIEESKPRSGEIVPLIFETHSVRMVMLRLEPWWVAVDACRVLEIQNYSQAVRGQERTRDDGTIYWSGGLDADEWGLHTVYTPSSEQQMLVVNLSGLLQLVLRSRKEEAKRFKRWITHEVVPTIMRTGTYSIGCPRLRKIQRQLNCDTDTAKARLEQIEANKERHCFLAAEKARVSEYAGWHNAGYRAVFEGREKPKLCEQLEISLRDTPLNHMDKLPLSTITHAKIIAQRMIEEAAKAGRPIPLDQQPAVLHTVAEGLRAHDLARFGPTATFDVVDDPQRGRILDVIRASAALD